MIIDQGVAFAKANCIFECIIEAVAVIVFAIENAGVRAIDFSWVNGAFARSFCPSQARRIANSVAVLTDPVPAIFQNALPTFHGSTWRAEALHRGFATIGAIKIAIEKSRHTIALGIVVAEFSGMADAIAAAFADACAGTMHGTSRAILTTAPAAQVDREALIPVECQAIPLFTRHNRAFAC